MARAARATKITAIDSATPSRVVLDETDRRIITVLQEDGRRAYGAIAVEVGLSEAAVRRRVQRLRDSGALEIVAVTDPLQFGFHREAIDEAVYVVLTGGSFDLLVEVIAEDDEHLVTILNDEIRSIDGVSAVETFLYLKLAKQTYAWGAR